MDAHGNSSRADGHTHNKRARIAIKTAVICSLIMTKRIKIVYIYTQRIDVCLCVFFWVRGAV